MKSFLIFLVFITTGLFAKNTYGPSKDFFSTKLDRNISSLQRLDQLLTYEEYQKTLQDLEKMEKQLPTPYFYNSHGMMYMYDITFKDGKKVKANRAKAASYFLKAAKMGDYLAVNLLLQSAHLDSKIADGLTLSYPFLKYGVKNNLFTYKSKNSSFLLNGLKVYASMALKLKEKKYIRSTIDLLFPVEKELNDPELEIFLALLYNELDKTTESEYFLSKGCSNKNASVKIKRYCEKHTEKVEIKKKKCSSCIYKKELLGE